MYLKLFETLLLRLLGIETLLDLGSFSCDDIIRQSIYCFAQRLADLVSVCGIDAHHLNVSALLTIKQEEFLDEEFPGAVAVHI